MYKREQQYTRIYDELVDKLGEGTWNVHVGGVNHVVEVGTGSNPFLMIYLSMNICALWRQL